MTEYGRKHTDGSRSGEQPPEGSREAAMVTIKDGVWCDPEIVDLVTALNTGDLATVASCSGHGHRPGVISLKDGRQLMVFDSLNHMEPASSAYPIDINGDPTASDIFGLVKDAIAEARVLWTAGQIETDDAQALVAAHYALPSVDHTAKHVVKALGTRASLRTQPTDSVVEAVIDLLHSAQSTEDAANKVVRHFAQPRDDARELSAEELRALAADAMRKDGVTRAVMTITPTGFSTSFQYDTALAPTTQGTDSGLADEDLWSDEICALIDNAFDTVSRSPSDHETVVAYRRAILAALRSTHAPDMDSGFGSFTAGGQQARADSNAEWAIRETERANALEKELTALRTDRKAVLEEAAQIVIAMIERENDQGDDGNGDYVSAWEKAVDNIRALKKLESTQ